MKRLLVVIICIILITGCTKEKELSEGEIIKQEYEKYNNTIKIESPNIIDKINIEEVENVNDGIIFIGSSNDSNSRIVLPILIKSIGSTALSKLYYVEIDNKEKIKIDIEDKNIPLILYKQDGKILEYIIEKIDKKMTDEDIIELYNKYLDKIHVILKDQCGEEKTQEEHC